jgi:hypothetical protein
MRNRTRGMFWVSTIALHVAVLAPSANATVVTRTYDFSASGFPAGSPQATVSGDFTVTYDPSVDSSSAGTPVSAIDLTIAGHTYTTSDTIFAAGPDYASEFVLAGAVAGFAVQTRADDMLLSFDGTPDGPFTNERFAYATAGTGSIYFASGVTVSLSSVPEPTTLPVLSVGLFSLVWMGVWRRRSSNPGDR